MVNHPNRSKRARIDERFDACGFVYVGQTRIGFAPRHTATRREEDRASTDLVISGTEWGAPSQSEMAEVIAALSARWPDRCLFVETSGGLVPVYEPPTPA